MREVDTGETVVVRRPTAVDGKVGARLRLRRTLLGLSQADVGGRCHISPQQVYKYEQGISAMTASRLVQFATVLDVPVKWFFEGIEARPDMPSDLVAMLADAETGEVAMLFHAIEDAAVRQSVIELLRTYTREVAASTAGQLTETDSAAC